MDINKLFSLKGRVAVVTGASRGLGKLMAEALASAGADIVINSRHIEELEQSAKDIEKATGRKVIPVAADISKPGDAEKLVESAVKDFGRLDILVNNAGIMVRKPTLDMADSELDDIIDVNLKGPVYLCRAAAREMIKSKWGRIINMGSIHSIVSIPMRAAYAATKGAILQMSKSLALEWAEHGITVNTICPGVFRTEINMDWMNDRSKAGVLLSKIPAGHFAEPRELAGTVVFLASEASRYITGTAIVVDGGYTAQ